MEKRIVITGLGVVSPIGIGKDTFWRNLVKGKSGISKVEAFDTSMYQSRYGGEIKNFRPEEFINKKKLKFLGRASQFAIAATKLALEDAGLNADILSKSKISVCMGTTMGEIQPIESLNKALVNKEQYENLDKYLTFQSPVNNIPMDVAIQFKLKGRSRIFTTACAAGNYAISYGFDLLNLEEADFVVAGGSDALSRISYTGFDRVNAIAPKKCQPFDKNRKGMIPGEGSGALILETLESAQKRNAHIYAEILGCGFSCDAHHMTHPLVEGIAKCLENALRLSNIKTGDVDYICTHGTGTDLNDKAECAAINKVFNGKKIAVTSCKSMLGHTMGAASAIEAIACCLAIEDNIIPPTINYETPDPECDIDCVPNKARKQVVNIALNNGFAFGGNYACLVLKKFQT